MIQMDIPAAFVCSQIFAYSGRGWLAREQPSWTGRYTMLAAAYGMGIIGACGLYLFSGWPEWEMMYWTEAVRMDTGNFGDPWLALVAPLFLVALGIAGMVGFKLAHESIVRGDTRRVLISLWAGVAISVGMVLVTPAAPMLVGHYGDYQAYMAAAANSADSWRYGIIDIGGWTVAVPWAADRALLDRHGLITFFDPAFFIPWLIDILVFLGSAFAAARWFKSHRQPAAAAIAQPRDAGAVVAYGREDATAEA